MLAAFRMVDGRQVIFHLKASKLDAGVVLATALAAVAISVEFCIVIGVFLSFVLYVPRAAHVRMARLTRTPDNRLRERLSTDAPCDRLIIYDLEGELFFGAEPELEKHFAAIERAAFDSLPPVDAGTDGKLANGQHCRVVILVLKLARNPDAAFLNLLNAFHTRLQRRQIPLLLCGVQSDLSKGLAATGLDIRIGSGRIFHELPNHNSSISGAVRCAYELLGESVCATCPGRQQKSSPSQTLEYVI
jgi:SulP family sulfate permease